MDGRREIGESRREEISGSTRRLTQREAVLAEVMSRSERSSTAYLVPAPNLVPCPIDEAVVRIRTCITPSLQTRRMHRTAETKEVIRGLPSTASANHVRTART